MAIAANALAGLAALVAWRLPRWRGRWVWVLTGVAQAVLVVQVTAGAVLVTDEGYTASPLHMFYGFAGYAAVALAYSSRDAMRGRLELMYGLVGLFLVGIGLRAWIEGA